ncbi:MAG: IclR family transcriptional regulator [Ilumatobacteraceae bacterium]|nr:IclR family transcriptional regulator [Ilumatobacteraceae bacterium]
MSTTTVQSIERAFAVLRSLTGGPAGVTELADRVELPKSTVSRLLSTLEELGAVEQIEAGGNYRIGAAMLDLAAAAQPGRSLVAAAHPQLAELARATGEAAGLSVADGNDMLYLDQVNPDTELQVRDWTGTRIPMHAVPSGQVLLAEAPPALVDAYVQAPMASFTPQTIVDPALLLARLDDVRRSGYAWAIDEFSTGLSSVAAAVRDADGHVVASMHVYGPTYRFPGDRDTDELGRMVVDAAARIRLG